MAWGLSLFVHKNGVCVGPGPPSLILYQLTPTPHPHTHSHEHSKGGNWLTADTFLSFFSSPFLLLSLCCHKIYCIPPARTFLKLQVLKFLSHEGRGWGQGCLWGCFVCMCVYVCERFTVLCFLLCLWPCRSHLDCLLCPDYVMDAVCVREIMMSCPPSLLSFKCQRVRWTYFCDYSLLMRLSSIVYIYVQYTTQKLK